MMRTRQGMTLLELVIAIAILAIMTTAGGAAFVSIIDRQETIRTASAQVERAAALRETIRQWILQGEIFVQRGGVPRGGRGGAELVRGLGAVPQGVTAAASTGNELTVTTNAPNPLMTAAVRIRLFIDVDPQSPEEGLTIEYQGSNGNSPLMRRQLDAEVGDLAIEFLDARTNRWYASSQAAAIDGYAIRLWMLPVEGKSIARTLQLPLTIVYGEPPTLGVQ